MDVKRPPQSLPAARRRVTIHDCIERPLRNQPIMSSPKKQPVAARSTDALVVGTSDRLQSIEIIAAQAFAKPAQPKQQRSRVLARRTMPNMIPMLTIDVPQKRSFAPLAVSMVLASIVGLGIFMAQRLV